MTPETFSKKVTKLRQSYAASIQKEMIGSRNCQGRSEAPKGGTSILGGQGGLAPKFASKILVGAPNFASKILGEKYPEFCPLNFRFDPKIGIFPQLLHLVITEVPKFFLLLVNLAGARSELGGGGGGGKPCPLGVA